MKKAGWRDSKIKQREVRIAIKKVLAGQDGRVDTIFEMVKSRHDY